MDGDFSALNFIPNAVSQCRTITFQPDVLPRCYLLLQVSDLEDAVIWLLHYIFWLEYPDCCKCTCNFATACSQA